jgi:hypothetical protein
MRDVLDLAYMPHDMPRPNICGMSYDLLRYHMARLRPSIRAMWHVIT